MAKSNNAAPAPVMVADSTPKDSGVVVVTLPGVLHGLRAVGSNPEAKPGEKTVRMPFALNLKGVRDSMNDDSAFASWLAAWLVHGVNNIAGDVLAPAKDALGGNPTRSELETWKRDAAESFFDGFNRGETPGRARDVESKPAKGSKALRGVFIALLSGMVDSDDMSPAGLLESLAESGMVESFRKRAAKRAALDFPNAKPEQIEQALESFLRPVDA